MQNLTYADVKKQSHTVFKQFGESKWIPFANDNVNLVNQRSTEELRNCGLGKVLVSVAMGASLEDQIETLKKFRNRCDILCCDKAFGVLLDHGITPDFVMLCDCNIEYRWVAPYIDKTAGIKLIATPYANTEWTKKWKGPVYFYVNRDAIETEKVFLPIMGPQGIRTIPASSNVSNAQVVFMTGNDEFDQTNFSGYDKILLVGYDYSWTAEGNYYAFSNPKPKRFYMAQHTLLDINRDIVLTSGNLLFSARWLTQFVNSWRLPIFNCSGRGLLAINKANLEDELSTVNPSATEQIRKSFNDLSEKRDSFNASLAALKKAREGLYNGSR